MGLEVGLELLSKSKSKSRLKRKGSQSLIADLRYPSICRETSVHRFFGRLEKTRYVCIRFVDLLRCIICMHVLCTVQ